MMRKESQLRRWLQDRARILSQIRQHLVAQGALEVMTPSLLPAALAHPSTPVFEVTSRSVGGRPTLYLQPSPELAMRSLVGEISEEIFQICSAYRDEPIDDTHKREFLLLEWYVPRLSYLDLCDKVCGLVQTIVSRPIQRISCAELFESGYNVDLQSMSDKNLAELHTRYFPCTPVVLDGHKFDDLLNRCLEPICAHSLTCVLDYPKFDPCFGNESPTGHIERFEVFLDGIEIANGYQEIQSRESFLERFRFENRQRHLLGLARLPEPAVSDIPSCSGVAVGLDRLIAITGGYGSIHEGSNREDSVFNPDWLHA